MRKLRAKFQPGCEARVHRAVGYAEVAAERTPHLRFLVKVEFME